MKPNTLAVRIIECDDSGRKTIKEIEQPWTGTQEETGLVMGMALWMLDADPCQFFSVLSFMASVAGNNGLEDGPARIEDDELEAEYKRLIVACVAFRKNTEQIMLKNLFGNKEESPSQQQP